MKRFITVIALSCALSASALAGDVPSVGAPAPGDIPTSGAPDPGEVETPGRTGLSSDALSALLSVLGFLA